MSLLKKHTHFILMLAIFIQAMIPVGFMPGKASASSFIEICSGDGLITVAVDHDGQPVDKHSSQKSCAYSLLPFGDVPPALVYAPVVFTHDAHKPFGVSESVPHHYSPLPPSTAPPVLI